MRPPVQAPRLYFSSAVTLLSLSWMREEAISFQRGRGPASRDVSATARSAGAIAMKSVCSRVQPWGCYSTCSCWHSVEMRTGAAVTYSPAVSMARGGAACLFPPASCPPPVVPSLWLPREQQRRRALHREHRHTAAVRCLNHSRLVHPRAEAEQERHRLVKQAHGRGKGATSTGGNNAAPPQPILRRTAVRYAQEILPSTCTIL